MCAITCHFVNDFQLYEELLAFDILEDAHTGENLRKFVTSNVLSLFDAGYKKDNYDDVIDPLKMRNLVGALTGNCATSNGVAFDNMFVIQRVRCFGHRLKTLGKSLSH